MRLLLCKSHFAGPVSGSDETLVAYATHLHRSGYDLAVVLLYPPAREDKYYERLRDAGVEVNIIAASYRVRLVLGGLRAVGRLLSGLDRLPATPRRLSHVIRQRVSRLVALGNQRRCRNYLEHCSADLMHVLTPDSGAELMIRAGAAAGIPVLYQELGTPHHMPELTPHYERFLKVLPLCSEVATLSPLLASQWGEKLISANGVSVLPMLVEDGHTPPAVSPPNGSSRIGFAARLESGKGPMILLEAFARVRRRMPHALLKLAGTGPQEKAVRDRADALGVSDACEYTGAYTSAEGRRAFMQSLDIFVHPSLAEGTPNSVIEAMAHGLPTVASAVGGIPDLITPETGKLVPPADVKALADAIISLASDHGSRLQIGRAARLRYEALFSPRSVLPMLASTYHRVAGKEYVHAVMQREQYLTHPWCENGLT